MIFQNKSESKIQIQARIQFHKVSYLFILTKTLLLQVKSTNDPNNEPSQHKGYKHIMMDHSQLIHTVPTTSGLVVTHPYDTNQAPLL